MAAEARPESGRQPEHQAGQIHVITNALMGRSDDVSMRQHRYLLTMAIRTLCFLGLAVTHGYMRWICVAGAAILPAIAVLLGNATDRRTPGQVIDVTGKPPVERPAIDSGHTIEGEVEE